MKYTPFHEQLPTEPGWYLYRHPAGITPVCICRDKECRDTLSVLMAGSSTSYPPFKLQGAWLGPISIEALESAVQGTD